MDSDPLKSGAPPPLALCLQEAYLGFPIDDRCNEGASTLIHELESQAGAGPSGVRGPKVTCGSEGNPIKNRACEYTPCNASFFLFLGPRGGHKHRKGSPKGAPRVPRRDPKTIKNPVFFVSFPAMLLKCVPGGSPRSRDSKSS